MARRLVLQGLRDARAAERNGFTNYVLHWSARIREGVAQYSVRAASHCDTVLLVLSAS